jgi:bifunctional non-homologous end joining protein LigD
MNVPNSEPAHGFVNPMLASSLDGRQIEEFPAAQWFMEEKLDGHRIVVAVDGDVRAWSRPRAGANGVGNGRSLPAHIKNVLAAFPSITLDGELCVPGGNSWQVAELQNETRLVYVIFDVLRYDGRDLTSLSTEQRREYVDGIGAVLREKGVVSVTTTSAVAPSRETIQAWWADGKEGAILKRRSSRYQAGIRSADWVKVKRVHTAVLTIVGFETGKNGPHSAVLLRSDDGLETKVKTLNADWLRVFAREADAYVGRKLRIEHQGEFMTKGKRSYRHPMFDYLEVK